MKKKYEKPEIVAQEMDMDLLRACANTGSSLPSRDQIKGSNCYCCIHISSGGTGFKHLSSAT